MARTWPTSFTKRVAFTVIDAVGYAATAPLRIISRSRGRIPEIRKILVIEPWQIGDVVLVTPLLAELRRTLPNAAVSLLAKPHAVQILAGTGLVDEVIEASLPWTRDRDRYRTSPDESRGFRRLVRKLRREKFDLVLDARGDPRTHLLAALSGARMRIGYGLAGGWLLTHALPAEPDKRHKIDDWLNLLTPLGVKSDAHRVPRLDRADGRSNETHRRARGASAPVIGFHPGGSHAGKRWPLDRFAAMSREIRSRFGGSTIVFLEPGGYGNEADWVEGSELVRGGLSDLMAGLQRCDLLICNDSGPMHLADALGVPLVAVFERGNPQWFGPSGLTSRVVAGESAGKGLSPAPVDLPPPNPIPVGRVLDCASQLLQNIGFPVMPHGEHSNSSQPL